MKNIKHLFIIISFVLGFSACNEDYLEREPILENSRELILSDREGMALALNGLYAEFYHAAWYGAAFPIIADLKGNNGKSSPMSSGRYQTNYNWYQDPSNTQGGLWFRAYRAITSACNIINAHENVTPRPGERQAHLDHIKAEALFVRALSHFDLVRTFAQPYTHQPDGLGVPVVLVTQIASPARNTTREVYQQIVSDLTEARGLFSTDYNQEFRSSAQNMRGFTSRDAATALLARVHLYMGEYAQAATYATEIIDSGRYQLYTADNYATVWGKNAQSEIIFEISGSTGNSNWPSWEELGYIYYPGGAYGDVSASNDLLNLFEAGDVRRNLFVGSAVHPGFYWPGKYPGKEGNERQNNIPLLRLSEMYLIRAEARLQGAPGNALDDYNAIRTRRGLDAATAVTFDEIFDERRRELCFEAHVLFDYARTKRTLLRQDEDNRIAGPVNIEFPSHLWAIPIPIQEMEANPNMQQNPGY